jgi:hypothetical protein
MIKNLLQNKRGDIPITIFVIGVLAICILAIFSFYSSDRNVKDDFSSISAIEKVLIVKEKISLYEDFGFTQEEIKEIFNIKDDIQGRYITAEEGPLLVRYNLPK